MLVFCSSFLLDLKLTLLECQGQRFHCCSNLPVQDCQEIKENQGILFSIREYQEKTKSSSISLKVSRKIREFFPEIVETALLL